jgi:UDP:flavonoid glycosyltransferase YjiC (YdhE family)
VAELAPRFIVHDGCAPWGSIVAELLRVPHASLMTALPMAMADRDRASQRYPSESLAILDAAVDALKKEFAVDFNHNHAYELYAPYTIVTSSRAWHRENQEFPTDQFRYWGPLVPERKVSTTVEGSDAVERLLSDDLLGSEGRPFMFCSLGTVTTGSGFALFGAATQDYYQKLCRAAALLPRVTFVFAVGKKAEVVEEEDAGGLRRIVELFGERVPENVVVARSVNQPKVLRRANAFLTHCGQNSAGEAVLAAVPVITAPFFGDQIFNALRFEELGCGLSQSFHADLKSAKGWSPDLTLISPEALAAAMRRVLEEPHFREAALALRARQEAEIGLPMADKLADLVTKMDQQAKSLTRASHGKQSPCGGA